MPVYVIIAIKNPPAIGRQIETDHGGSFLKVKDDVWLVDYVGTTRELTETLGIRSGDVGSGLVLPISNYGGRASADIWEWLKLHMSKDD